MASDASSARLAIDVGGTFTDVVLEKGRKIRSAKVLTTPDAPERAILEGSRLVLAEVGLKFSDLAMVIHGTTLATNAIIERKGARTALIATEGFRDVIEIADEGRYDQYDLEIEKPQVLVPRHLRFSVKERVDVHGKVRLPLDEASVDAIAQQLMRERIEAVAISLIHAYANPSHERRIAEILARVCPSVAVTLSSEACPEVREYERTSTAVANAYVQPLMAGYLGRLEAAFASEGCRQPIQLVTSGGSLTSVDVARRLPVRLVESGPAGGAILAATIAAEREATKVLSFDMGGTTAKICLIHDCKPFKARTFEVDRAARFLKGSGLPVRIPVIEMVEIGAGGGSIARVDALRRITVGPDSAASVPGPACYARGGTDPTVTDADVVLGRIDVEGFAGGRMTLEPQRSTRSIEAAIGRALELEVQQSAFGISEIVDENMSNAARVHAVERGVVISDHTLVAFGGAAPLHACRMAEKLGINRIVIPSGAGVGSAIGFLRAPAAFEIIRSRFWHLDDLEVAHANRLLNDMSREAREMAAIAAQDRPLIEERHAFMRYTGQGHEISIPLPARELREKDLTTLRDEFEAHYRRLFDRHIPGARIEILSWSTLISTKPPASRRLPREAKKAPAPEAIGSRKIWDQATGASIAISTFARDSIKPGARVQGPALILEAGTSTFVSRNFEATVDNGDALVLERRPSSALET